MARTVVFVAVLIYAALAGIAPAKADVVVNISISRQSMTVTIDGMDRFVWPVSTARRGYVTPTGSYRVQSMHKMHYSSLFNDAPMPFTIFFHGHYAIHGTYEVKKLGRPASAGCIRLHPDNARFLFDLVKERGPTRLQVVLES
jgi:lipoprotein-anchoring transpeptidase ErfK/SrfK